MSTDKFDNIPKIVLDKEDRDAFHRGRASTGGSKAAKTAVTEPVERKSSGSGWVTFVLLIALGGYGASYYLYHQSQLQQAAFEQAEERIFELERKLSATDEELDQSAVALRVQVTELKEKTEVLWGEMDKLWASAWRRNQTEIKDLTAKINKDFRDQTQRIVGLENEIGASSTGMAVLQEQVDQQLAKAQQLSTSFESVVKNIESVVQNSAAGEQERRELGDQIATTALRIEALVDRINELEQLREQLNNPPPPPVRTPVSSSVQPETQSGTTPPSQG